MRCLWGWLAVALVAVQVVAAQPPAAALVTAAPTERLIVKLRGSLEFTAQQAAPARVAALIERNGLIPVEVRHIVAGIHLVRVQAGQASPTQAQVLARLRADPEVEYAEVDQRRYPNAEPDDPLFINQWYLQNAQPAALDAIDAWNMTSGSPGLVIADLDTGVLFDHPDLRNDSANRLLPGYNLISNADIANNGYGRGPDASDPGDWISASDLTNPVFANCTIANSSWHGTRVAGVLGALTNNQTGVAGLTWQGWIEPVRVLGKCGGYDSDIIAGMAWAAGNAVEGVPINPYPARIVNMSLGSVGSCPSSYQQMVDELVSEGVLVVVSAGNEGGPVDAPANCSGVLAVAGLREDGTKVGYSSLGPQVTLSAPAGNCVNTGAGQPCLFSIETTTNSGTTVPVTNTYTDEYNYNIGTSFSAPQVAATAGLMLAVNGNLSPAQLMQRLQEAAQPFPVSSDPGVPVCHVPADATDLQTSECNCTAATCGVGMANADQAVIGALRPIAAVVLPLEFPPGSTITMDGSGSAAACNASLVTYHWTVVQPASHPPAIHNAGSAKASIVAPPEPETYTLMLTVTDSQGRSDTATVLLSFDSASSTAATVAGTDACLSAVSYIVGQSTGTSTGSGAATSPAGSSGGGGGGGALDLWTLLVLGSGALALGGKRRYSSRCAASSHTRCARR